MVEIVLAGYNVDSDVLEELKSVYKQTMLSERNDVTPETISAAYARISRDPKSATELRREAREEVDKARKSNQTIVYKMGHHSIAEHAVFNFDILNISRLAIETLEAQRLCSYTEKSQRYITLGEEFLVPEELKRFEPEITNVFKKDFQTYKELAETIHAYLRKSAEARTIAEKMIMANKEMGVTVKDEEAFITSKLQEWAKEDARYVLPLATLGQLGMTTNARNLEKFIRDSAISQLSEVRELGRKLFESVYTIAPSLFLFTEPNDYHKGMQTRLKDYLVELEKGGIKGKHQPTYDARNMRGQGAVMIIPPSQNLDDKVIAALLMSTEGNSYIDAYAKAKSMPQSTKNEFMKQLFKGMNMWDDVPREFEMAELVYDVVMSASAFAQFKRHRMLTLIKFPYDTWLGFTTPDSVVKAGAEEKFIETIKANEDLYEKIMSEAPHIGEAAHYALTNAHNRRVLVKTNIRELYKISRLRQDLHAQWDIRSKVDKMAELARQVAPLSCMMLGGKHEFKDIYNSIYKEQ